MDYVLVILPHLLNGALVTLQLMAACVIGILAVGLLASLGKVSPWWIVRFIASIYIDLARAIPLLVQLFLIYYSLPHFGISLPVFWAGVLGLVLHYAAYEAEIIRGGLQSIDRGQVEAGVALGMPPVTVLRRITIRQALKVILPPTTSLFASTLKGTAQVAVIALPELLRTGSNLALSSGEFFIIYGLIALIYLCMTYPISRAARALEHRVSPQ